MWASKEIAQSRFDICKECEHFFKPTLSCKKCGCFMKAKVKVARSVCPIDKWTATTDPISEQGDD